jgi:hypothetical protein
MKNGGFAKSALERQFVAMAAWELAVAVFSVPLWFKCMSTASSDASGVPTTGVVALIAFYSLRRSEAPMGPRVQQSLSRIFFLIGLGCLVLAGWLWWIDRPPAAVLRVEAPIELGGVAVAADHAVDVPVVNTGSEPIRLVGLENELC